MPFQAISSGWVAWGRILARQGASTVRLDRARPLRSGCLVTWLVSQRMPPTMRVIGRAPLLPDGFDNIARSLPPASLQLKGPERVLGVGGRGGLVFPSYRWSIRAAEGFLLPPSGRIDAHAAPTGASPTRQVQNPCLLPPNRTAKVLSLREALPQVGYRHPRTYRARRHVDPWWTPRQV
jgi:hypothetical protein